jgi:hypothetical protein
MPKTNFFLALLGGLFCTTLFVRAVDPTWNYAVEVSATVPAVPPWSITLSWPEDTAASASYAPNYTVYRKDPATAEWGEGKFLGAGQTLYVDDQVEEGVRYEYRIAREFRHPHAAEENHDGYGYIQAGINVAPVHQRGRALLVVENRVAENLAGKIAALRRDLVGDGWTVTQLDVAADAAPAEVQALIRAEAAQGSRAEAVLLVGRVPIARAGRYAPDGHEARAMPADVFYGDLDGEWKDANGDGIYDGNQIPSDIELQIGRVDFAQMDGVETGKTDLELLERYLDKAHAFRHAEVRPPRRALVGDRVGRDRGRAPAASGYRAFATFFGPENVARADVEDNAPEEKRWISELTAEPYLWAFGSGGGSDTTISFLGLRDEYRTASSVDLAAGAKATFYLLFGSYFVDWSKPNNLLRAALAAPTYGLASAWAGRPSLYFHPMGLGETIGHGMRLSQNNDGVYYSPGSPNSWRRHVHIALMGDPTLRLDYVAPATELVGSRDGGAVALAWKASADAAEEPMRYFVYRGAGAEGPFALVTPDAIAETAWTDAESPEGTVYMVRSVKLQTTSSGTYWNLGQGAFWAETR